MEDLRRIISLEAAGLIRRPKGEDERRQGVIDVQQLLHWPAPEGTPWLRGNITGREAALYGVILSRHRAIHDGIVNPEDDVATALAQSAGIGGRGVETFIRALGAANASISKDSPEDTGGGNPWYKFW